MTPKRHNPMDGPHEEGVDPRLIPARHWEYQRHGWAEAVRHDASLSPMARLIGNELALTWSNAKTQRCDPSYEKIAELLGTSRDTVKRAVRDLVKADWIVTVKGRGRSNHMEFGFLSRSRIVPIKGGKNALGKGGRIAPFSKSEKGADLPGKGGKSALPYNKDKHCKNTVGRAGSKTGAKRPSGNPAVVQDAERAVSAFREGRDQAFEDLKPWVVNHIIAANLLTDEERQRAGLC